jgi:hypothetical protein
MDSPIASRHILELLQKAIPNMPKESCEENLIWLCEEGGLHYAGKEA